MPLYVPILPVRTVSASYQRPADSIAYSPLDVVGAASAVWSFPGIGAAGTHVVIVGAALRVDVGAVPAGMSTFRLHLYNASPASPLADNAPYNLSVADRASYLSYIDLGAPTDLGDTLFSQTYPVTLPLPLLGTGLFGYLQTVGGFPPPSGTIKTVRLTAIPA